MAKIKATKKKKTFVIPKGFHRCACSELRFTKAESFYSPDRALYYIVLDDEHSIGPMNKNQLEALLHAGKDCFEDTRAC